MVFSLLLSASLLVPMDMNSWTHKVTAFPQPPIQDKILNSCLVQKKHGGIDVQVKLVLVVDQRERNEIP